MSNNWSVSALGCEKEYGPSIPYVGVEMWRYGYGRADLIDTEVSSCVWLNSDLTALHGVSRKLV